MKQNCIVATLLAAFCLLAACSKKSTDEQIKNSTDSSDCVLANVSFTYDNNLPYYSDPFAVTYDSLGRITTRQSYGSFLAVYNYETDKIVERVYINSTVPVDSLMVEKDVYVKDANNRITISSQAWYNKPKSEDDYSRKDSSVYQYDAGGYLTSKKIFAFGKYLSEEFNYTYADSNCLTKEHIYYDYWTSKDIVRRGADSIKYTYDKTAWYPETAYLYEVSNGGDLRIGKPNKNNVVLIALKMFDGSGTNSQNLFTSIAYTYNSGAKPVKVKVKALTTKGYQTNTEVNFGYKCN
ncbi:hypothetical protein [Chitinophaga sp.]|uniref:hypothetical protein n=1 Tax=Chitinophaga sp. TaxID=1869181 RepID=UPI0031E13A8E